MTLVSLNSNGWFPHHKPVVLTSCTCNVIDWIISHRYCAQNLHLTMNVTLCIHLEIEQRLLLFVEG